jgi:Carboxypeptidase regulatory-like domain
MSKLLRMLVIVCFSVSAQSNFATLSGRITDPSSAPVSGAEVVATARATDAVRNAATNEQGLYEFPNILPGEYTISVKAPGFPVRTENILLEVGQHMGLDLALQLSEKHEEISVVGTAEILKTQDVSLGEVVEPKSIDDLPLNGRMLIDLTLTVPDAHVSHGAQTGDMSPLYWRPGQRSSISVGGNRPDANYFLLDGVTNTDTTLLCHEREPFPGRRRGIPGANRKLPGGTGRSRRRTDQYHHQAWKQRISRHGL